MSVKRWMVIGVVWVVACLLVALVAGLWLVKNVPAAHRLVYGDPPTPTPQATLVLTYTPLPPSAPVEPSLTLPPATITPLPSATLPLETPPTEATSWPTLTSLPTSEPPTATSEPPTEAPRPPTPTPRPEWIAFESKRDGRSDYEIFVMRPDGSHVANVTNSWADDVAPVWSPDGRRIAFVSLRDTVTGKWDMGPSTIYLLDFDPLTGTGVGDPVRLTSKETNDGWPTWSPDGQRIAFESDRSGNWDIWVVNVDGTGLARLTHDPSDDRFPSWSPDGEKIAFTSRRSGNFDVWLMNADGSKPLNLTRMPGRDRYAMWSPDGKKITFNTRRDGNQEIYVMNADGSRPRNVTNAPDSIEGLADWSPDGKRLVLYSDRPGNKDIFILDLVTGKWTNISKNPGSDEFCTWSPRK